MGTSFDATPGQPLPGICNTVLVADQHILHFDGEGRMVYPTLRYHALQLYHVILTQAFWAYQLTIPC